MGQVRQALDEEHRTNLDLLGRIEQAFVRARGSAASRDPEFAALARNFGRHLRQDIGRHFDFEERELFPLLDAAGEGDIAGLLKEEHEAIRAVATELLPLNDLAAARDARRRRVPCAQARGAGTGRAAGGAYPEGNDGAAADAR